MNHLIFMSVQHSEAFSEKFPRNFIIVILGLIEIWKKNHSLTACTSITFTGQFHGWTSFGLKAWISEPTNYDKFPIESKWNIFCTKKIKFNKKIAFREKTDEKNEKKTEKLLWGAIRRQFDYGHSQYGPKTSTRNYEDQKIRIDLKLETSNVKRNLKSETEFEIGITTWLRN